MKPTRIAVIIVAGGSGTRMGGTLPKQFLSIGGKPILMHTIERFAEAAEGCRIIVVLPHNHTDYWQKLCEERHFTISHTLCVGGENRFESVRNGLEHIGDAELVAVHDGVRPLVSRSVIERTLDDAKVLGAVIPVVTPVDSLRRVDENGSHVEDRNHFRIIQTPQAFKAEIITSAYQLPYSGLFTDDASVVEANGGKIYLCEGSYTNIKITTPVDMLTAEAILGDSQK